MTSLKRKAFTLVELVIVIAVISILAAVLIPTFSGIIRSANKSADEQILASINLGLAMADKIENEDDLKKAINETFSEGTYEKLAPKSAQYGYYYWYDVETNTVVLKTYSEIEALHNERASASSSNAKKRGAVAMAATVAKNEGFKDSEKSNFRMFFDNFFILDKGGSVVAEAFEALNTGAADLVEKVTALETIKTSSDNKELADALLDKLNKIALVSNDMTYVRNADSVESIYFVPGITTIPTFTGGSYIAKAENIKGNIVIPATVTTVQENALNFDISGVKLQTSYESADKIAEVFQANSTNATILSAADLEYTIDGGTLVDPDGNEEDLAYGNPVASFEIVTPDDTSDYKSVLNNIYVAYNYTGTIQLGVGSFVGVNAGAVSSEAVTWNSDNEHVVVDKNNGTLSINGLPELEECTATITATAVAGGATASVQINIIRVAGYSVKLNETILSQTTAYEAEYKIGTPKSYTVTVTPTYNIDDVEIKPDFSVAVTTSGDEFTYNNGTLSMVLDSNNNPVFSIKEGETARTLKTTLTVAVPGETRTYDIVFTDKSESPLEVTLPNVNDYLYFIGNNNAIKLSSLFKVKEGHSLSGEVTVEVIDVINSGEDDSALDISLSSATGLEKTITLPTTFEGPVEIRVTAHGMTTSLYANVVDATNVTTYSELKNQNSVLLSDITMSNNSSYYLSNATLYGNGFTFDVRDGAYSGSGYVTSNYLIGLSNANIDNIKIEGKVYTSYGVTSSADYNRAVVFTTGNCRITNSYISNCATPVRVSGGETLIENSTLKGGAYANLDIRNGNVTVRNLTTINQVSLNDKADNDSVVIGLGIVIYYEQVLKTTTLTIEGTFTQYNYISKSQADSFADERADIFIGAAFGDDYSKYQFTDASGDEWLHVGIVSMSSNFGKENINGGEDLNKYNYVSFAASKAGYEGYIWDVIPTADAIAYVPDEWKPTKQALVAPKYSFEYPKKEGDKNYLAKVENDYCNYDDGKIYISMDEGDTFEFDPAILTVTKNGYTLSYSVAMNGTDYTGKKITFDTSGDYTIVYTYTDGYNYDFNGEVIGKSEETYTKTVFISVSVVKPEAKSAIFTFGSENIPSKTLTVGNKTYVMPDVSSTSNTIGSVMEDGETIYCPIINCNASNGKTSQTSGTTWYMLFPVFKDVITITDYANGGTGSAITYDASATTLPAGLAAVNPDTTFQYAAASTAPTTPSVYSNVLCYTSPAMEGVNRDSYTINARYTYTDNKGTTYNYYVQYITPKITNSGCVTPDTLVTLADGTKKEIQYVTYEDKLLVWDFNVGAFAIKSASALINHGEGYYNVISLKFSDGTVVNVIDKHGFFDVDQNKFVFIGEDNVENYLGHQFVKQNVDSYNTVTLIDYTVSEQYTTAYSILSHEYDNAFVEGMLSITPFPGIDNEAFYGCLVVGKNMTYDFEAIQSYIDMHGLYTFEELAVYGVSYDQYIGANLAYLKIMVGEGIVTLEEALNILSQFVPQ